jgi:phosphatidate cytidylyltransferase
MNNLSVRALTGSLFIVAIIGAILWDPRATTFLFGAFMALGIHEFTGLINLHTMHHSQRGFAVIVSLIIYAAAAAVLADKIPASVLYLAFPLLTFSFLISLSARSETSIQDVSLTWFGIGYILIPFLMIMHLCFESDPTRDVVGMFVLIWTNDTFAYVTGRLFGRTRLFERISPKKTWEGTIGGIFFTLTAGVCWSLWMSELSLEFWLVASPLVAFGAIFGDLFESQLKRQIGIKDSGNALPGHGGILDRFDAALMAVPFFYGLWMIYR